ncbi:anaerobic C4-dicarboxylate transporter [Syntrophobacter fumaroxidans]|uniref:C4-dicarboxylate transporter DcuA n=1 Tax=Syntrophobacter fumaroxidans (strain DSM 10017 / MPOB) TaxID=335543 RepID=A0LFT5_SYNFM|nr:anaerobic C4-dicarboxylate transporter [Syntrophobacter fumaroxidans]ABK16287.1 anaerobic c4-dicarboxylate antiporter, Dcu family [Syntrophobacter fumaroxidans MPOB]
MWIVELLVVLFFIWLGARLGSIGIGYAGGFGVLVLSLGFGLKPGDIPFDVILIIMGVIAAIAAMQEAGGLEYLVQVAARVLKKNPKYITFLAPAVTYFMTLFAGTGHTAFLALPVIAEVAKKEGIRPSRPLAIGTVASQIAITASPISAAVVFVASALEPVGVDYVKLLLITIPSTFIACMLGAIITNFMGKELKDDPVYQDRLAKGLVKDPSESVEEKVLPPGAKLSVLIFGLAIVCVVFYATAISPTVGLIKKPILARDHAIISFMLAAASLIALLCKVKTNNIVNAATFKSGMSACICVLGVAWLGTTFVSAHLKEINILAGDLLASKPWMLAVVLFFAAMLLYSQAATAKALMPVALALGVSPVAAVAAFPSVSALFVLPTYPTLLAAVEFDDTGSTRIGKYVFDHPFLIPGVLTITFAIVLGYVFGRLIL